MATTITGTEGVDKVQDGSIHEEDINADVARIGIGQTWQNVTGSRALDTPYTNTTGKPIFVYILASVTSTTTFLVQVDTVQIHNQVLASTGSTVGACSFIVPNGSTYTASNTNGLARWSELR